MKQELLRRFNHSPLVVLELLQKVAGMALGGLWWRLRLKHAAGLLLISRRATIRNPQYISVGRNFVAEDYCEIQGLSTDGVTFGNNVTVGRFAMIRPSGYYSRDIGAGLRVGDHSNIGAYCYIGCSGAIEIGSNVMMGPRVSLFAENHVFDRVDLAMKAQGVHRQPIVIADDCWLASHSVIMAGVRIGRGAVVAAGSIVTEDIPPYAVVGGVPARLLKWRKKHEL